ncbi:MAG: DUF1847 domain-containing protein [Lachnospiraceae bacterium]|nr:DUF1847 domain-containing protein [Lachnospiraceae bacterium]
MYTCAKCSVLACSEREPERKPKNCPGNNQDLLQEALAVCRSGENRDFYINSSEIEALGYGQWVRVRETMEFCRRMGYHKLGLAFCRGLRKEARIAAEILERNGFQVESVICKSGGVDKCEIGIPDEHKVHPGAFEPMCNPVFQAKLLNEQKTEFNIALGLCVGHDSFFYKYSDAMVTTLVVKDRVLAHNPVGALYGCDGYFKNKIDCD